MHDTQFKVDKGLCGQLQEWVKDSKPYAKKGKVASYIPALQKADATDLGVCVIGPDGTTARAGAWNTRFTMQSVSKVMNFVTVCEVLGLEKVLQHVDVEPTGDPFDSMIRLEVKKPGKPFNPFINGGAISIASMLPGATAKEIFTPFNELMEKLIGRELSINEEAFHSEWETANRNRSIAYYLKESGFLYADVDQALEVYLRHCSIEVDTQDLAIIGLVLACDGYHPFLKRQVIAKETARVTKSLMLTCGTYNDSGKFAAFVSMPTKSGVSGAMMSSVPPRVRVEGTPFSDGCGVGVYGPAIDKAGNSVAGRVLLEKMSKRWDLSIF